MPLSKQQISTLVSLVVATSDDSMDCDGCFGKIAEFADAKLAGRSLNESMLVVQNHLENCPCCQDEFQALLAAMTGVVE